MKITAASNGYVYTGTVTNVVDGDTVDVLIDPIAADVGFGFIAKISLPPKRFRLADINCPERSTGAPGKAATDYTRARLLGREVTVHSAKTDQYERWIGRVIVDGADISKELVAKGLAVPYMEGKSGV